MSCATMRQKAVSLFLCYLLLYTCGCCGEEGKDLGAPKDKKAESFRIPRLETQACL